MSLRTAKNRENLRNLQSQAYHNGNFNAASYRLKSKVYHRLYPKQLISAIARG